MNNFSEFPDTKGKSAYVVLSCQKERWLSRFPGKHLHWDSKQLYCDIGIWTYCIWNHYALKVKIIKPIQDQNVTKAWFSLVHKHRHRDIPTCQIAYLTQFLIPALLNPMVNKVTDALSTILLLICSHEVLVKVTYDWPTALCLCLCLCWLHFH